MTISDDYIFKVPLRLTLLAILVTSFLISNGQQPVSIAFYPTYNGTDLELNRSTKQVKITTLRFYISKISLKNGGIIVWKEAKSNHLLDAEEKSSLSITLDLPEELKYDELQFQLGIDSLTNVSGAMGGDLDPTKGMYWTWNSGYINFKLEGTSSDCPTRNHEFSFHLGGYLPPHASVRTINFPVKQHQEILLKLDLDQFLSGINLETEHTVMSPGESSGRLSSSAASAFSIYEAKK